MTITKMSCKALENVLKTLCQDARQNVAGLSLLGSDERLSKLRELELELKCVKILNSLDQLRSEEARDLHITFDGGCDKWAQ